jgi:hemerythrin superfamily protein
MVMPSHIDTLLSKGRGKLKAMKARLDGVAGVFKTLTEQHGEVEALLGSVKRDADKRQDLWPKLRTELLSHERAEIQEVYPALRAHVPTRPLADQHDAEAAELEQLITKLDAIEISSDAWGTVFDQLADAVTAHATEEETEIFPIAQSVLGEARAKQLDAQFLSAKQRIAASV